MDGLLKIEFPLKALKIRGKNGARQVFDAIRKTWVALTPEEWVRQNFIQFLLSEGYPASLLSVEKKILVNQLTKRCDIVVYSRATEPIITIECKKMDVPLSPKVLEQALRYHITLQTRYLIITNGINTIGFRKNNNRFLTIETFPSFEQINDEMRPLL